MVELRDLSKNQLDVVLKKYLIDHSSRKLNFLYWNISDPKDQYLQFINITGKELNRINNNDLVYRLIKVKNQEDWQILNAFINQYLTTEDKKSVYVIRVDFLLSHLKSIKFDLDNFSLEWDAFVGYIPNEDATKRKAISFINDDIQSIYLINRLFLKYKKFISVNDIPDSVINSILEQYLTEDDFKYNICIDQTQVMLPAVEALDIIAKKFIVGFQNKRLEQIYIQNALSTIMSKFVCQDMIVISVRAYIQLFLNSFLSNKVKKNGRSKCQSNQC